MELDDTPTAVSGYENTPVTEPVSEILLRKRRRRGEASGATKMEPIAGPDARAIVRSELDDVRRWLAYLAGALFITGVAVGAVTVALVAWLT